MRWRPLPAFSGTSSHPQRNWNGTPTPSSESSSFSLLPQVHPPLGSSVCTGHPCAHTWLYTGARTQACYTPLTSPIHSGTAMHISVCCAPESVTTLQGALPQPGPGTTTFSSQAHFLVYPRCELSASCWPGTKSMGPRRGQDSPSNRKTSGSKTLLS